MKTGIKLIFSILLIFNFNFKALSAEKIKIGLLIPVTGEYGKIGRAVINSVRLALNSINDNRIEILPRDTRADPSTTLKIAKDLAKEYHLRVPITEMLYNLVFHEYDFDRVINFLMTYPYDVDVDFL